MHAIKTEYLSGKATDGNGNDTVAFDEPDALDVLLEGDDEGDGQEAALVAKLTHGTMELNVTLSVLLIAQNIFFVLSAYWIFLITRELFKLALTTVDRGAINERRVIRLYASGALFIFAAFVVSAASIVIPEDGYNRAYRLLVIIELVIIIMSICYALGSLWVLRSKGRQKEHIHGLVLASPLYRRLKLVMIVCALFTLPYCTLQTLLLCVRADQVDLIPDVVVGVLTTLYYLFGAAQAIAMAASQQCCLSLLRPFMPAHLRNAPEWQTLRSVRRTIAFSSLPALSPPENPVFVNTDIESSSALWAQAPEDVIDDAQEIHDDLLRSLSTKYRGYEITTCGDAFQLAFHSIGDAISFCMDVQLQLLEVKWPHGLEGVVPSTKTKRVGPLKKHLLFRGIRVRMGIHDANEEIEGALVSQVHPVTGKTLYLGVSELIGREVGDVGFGGEILVSERVAKWVSEHGGELAIPHVLAYHGVHTIAQLEIDVPLYQVTPKLLEGRCRYFRKKRGLEDQEDVAIKIEAGAEGGSTTDESGGEYHLQRSPSTSDRVAFARMWQTKP